MDRVIVTRPMLGITEMQVCAIKDVTDKEILEVCNFENPSGTTEGWNTVVRNIDQGFEPDLLPVQCEDYSNRLHFVVVSKTEGDVK